MPLVALRDLSDPEAVVAALDEFDATGRIPFLRKYGFGTALRYMVRRNGKLYDSKAIAAAAHGYQFGRPLRNDELSGGVSSAVPKLRELDFEVVDVNPKGLPDLDPDRVYSWDELAAVFGFKPNYFSAAGGMVPSKTTGALLLITHPGGGKSFDYADHWNGDELVYTGKGKLGDQQPTGQNLDVIEDRRELYVFEAAGPRRLLFLGRARRVETRIARAPDDNDEMRDVFQFRLAFDRGAAVPRRRATPPPTRPRQETGPQPRPFRDERPPASPPTMTEPANPEVTAAKREQANAGHHAILVALNRTLTALGCQSIEELPGAIDLRATRPDGTRMIFEAKTIGDTNELSQTRAGFAQLVEYRVEHGASDDELCLVVDRPLSVRRQKLLDALDVAALVVMDSDLVAANDLGSRLVDRLTS